MRSSASLPLLLALAAALLLAACARPDRQEPPRPDGSPEVPVPSAPLPGPEFARDSLAVDGVPIPRAGEIIRIDPETVLGANVETDGRRYEVEVRPRLRVEGNGQPRSAPPAAINAWLQRFAPLEGDGQLEELTPDMVQTQGTHRIIFFFEDDSAVALTFLRRGDRVGVTSRPEGPVYALPASRLAELVPEPGALGGS